MYPKIIVLFCFVLTMMLLLAQATGMGVKLNAIIRPVYRFLSSCIFRAFLSGSPIVIFQ